MTTRRLSRSTAVYAAFVALAALLLVLTLRWRIALMLWDHLDLVPIYLAWRDGTLASSIFLQIHGGHIHTAAYAVLLVTTALSHGQTWLDGVASWLLLIAYAALVLRFARDSFDLSTPRGRAFALPLVLLALYPGHLANLQWGWQVAVFLCLLGIAATIRALTRTGLPPWRWLLAIAASVLALASFATALALVPTALLLIALRVDWPVRRRVLVALPWLVGGLALAFAYPRGAATADAAGPATLAHYALNFLGSGIARFAPRLAPWLAAIAITTGLLAIVRLRLRRDSLPWLGLFAFAILAALLTAAGRAAPFGAEHAFVTRYVSFSSLFWLGWYGLIGCAVRDLPRVPTPVRTAAWILALFALVNSVHLLRKAAGVSAKAQAIAATIRADYPALDRRLLGEIYFDQPDVARERLAALRALGFAPFDRAARDGAAVTPPR